MTVVLVSAAFIVVLLVVNPATSGAFTVPASQHALTGSGRMVSSRKVKTTTTIEGTLLRASSGNDDDSLGGNSYSDLPPPDESTEYTGSVDWDAEWKKVVANEGKLRDGSSRPGRDFYKSEAEIAAIKAANKATEQISKAGSTVSNSLPDIRSLSGDWRFWIALLALVSVGISVLTAPQMVPSSGLQGDSYYI
jgi:hypothetical protein